jgi:RNA polymerase sigma factor (sigma-70 family)
MAGGELGSIIRQLHRVLGARDAAEQTDAQLLEGFLACRDESAFAALVRRHGPMVLAVCQRVLRDRHDAEDAFQATFLVLLRKAGSLRGPGRVGNWLYGVAYRTALKAKTTLLRRRLHEKQLEDLPGAEPVAELVWQELRVVLDEELQHLPEKYRAPVVLHYLEGQTKRATAHHLGCPEGTVSIRLARARELLRRRLARRGVALSVGVVAAALAQTTASAVPPALASATVKAAVLLAAGQAVTSVVSTQVIALTQGVLRAMFLTKLNATTGLLLTVCLGASAVGVAAYPVLGAGDSKPEVAVTDKAPTPAPLRADQEPPKADSPKEKPADAPKEKPADPPKDKPADSEEKAPPALLALNHDGAVHSIAFSPDGKTIATACADKLVRLWDVETGKEVQRLQGMTDPVLRVVFSADGQSVLATGGGVVSTICRWDTKGRLLFKIQKKDGGNALALSPDGKILAASSAGPGSVGMWDVATGKQIRLMQGHRDEVTGVAFSPDGRMLASSSKDKSVNLWDMTTGQQLLSIKKHDDSVAAVAFSSNGTTVASASDDKTIRLWDVKEGKQLHELAGHAGAVHAIAFSPDGKTLASVGADRTIRLWDADSGKPIRKVVRHPGAVHAVAFSPDGKWVASAGADGRVLVSTVVGLREWQAKPIDLTAKQLDDLWGELAGNDVSKRYEAVAMLVAGGKHAVPFLKEHLKPAEALEVPKEVAQLIKDLDNETFEVRQKASDELAKAGKTVEKHLRAALEDKPSLEMRKRLEQLLEKLEPGKRPPLTPEELRGTLAVWVLEEVGTDEARQVLSKLAKGAPDAPVTQEAKKALARLEKNADK